MYYSDIGQELPCDRCLSGEGRNCELCSEPVQCDIVENLSVFGANSELECRECCVDTPGEPGRGKLWKGRQIDSGNGVDIYIN